MEVPAEDGGSGSIHVRSRTIKKRALRNKSISVSFDEKDLKDYVCGFHKRKKKRRREAVQKQEEAERRKRIELRKKRKLERDFAVYGEAGKPPPDPDMEGDCEEVDDDDDDGEAVPSISGTVEYDTSDMQIMVRTSEISCGTQPGVDGRPISSDRFAGVEKTNQKEVIVMKKKKKQQVKKTRSHSKPRTKSKRDYVQKKKSKRSKKRN